MNSVNQNISSGNLQVLISHTFSDRNAKIMLLRQLTQRRATSTKDWKHRAYYSPIGVMHPEALVDVGVGLTDHRLLNRVEIGQSGRRTGTVS